MSSKLLAQHDRSTDRARHWDQPQGLGWQLWRRAHATALSGKQLQRDVRRFRTPPLMRHSLLTDIHKRWGVGQSPAMTRFYSDLPLFWTRAPLFYTGEPPGQSPSPHRELRRSVDAPPVSSLSGMSYLSRDFSPLPAMTTDRRSSSASGSINPKSDIRASQPTAALPEAQQNELVGSLLRHRDVPILRNLMWQGGIEQNGQYPLLNGKSRLSPSVTRQRSGGTPRSSSPLEIQQAETLMSVASDVSGPAYWSASRFYPVAHGDAAVVRLTPSLGGTEVSLRRHVGAVERQRTSVQRLPITLMRAREEE